VKQSIRLYIDVLEDIAHNEVRSRSNEKAKMLLQDTNMKIQDISNAVGYQSGVAFIRFFKKYNDMTPQEYRNRR